jgi:hypothetical protein
LFGFLEKKRHAFWGGFAQSVGPSQREQGPWPPDLWLRGSGSQRPTDARCTAQAGFNNQAVKWGNNEEVGPAQMVVAMDHG